MRQGQIRIVPSLGDVAHARSVNERGQIVPRCCAHRKTLKNMLHMTVTANVKRISCAACRSGLS